VRSWFLAALILLLIVVSGWRSCAARAPADARESVARFLDHANAGRIADLVTEYKREYRGGSASDADVEARNLKFFLERRAALGRQVRTTEASAQELNGRYRVVMVHHNTEFERGQGLEVFHFRIDEAGTRMSQYSFTPGKKVWCPTIKIWNSQCSVEDAR
jgi:hypothetical protein